MKVSLFGRDAAGQRDRAQAELKDARRQLADLQKRREAMLADGETTVVDLRKIDIVTGEAAATIALLEQRCAKLGVAVRKEQMAKLEAARTAALARVVEPQFAKIAELAVSLELSIANMSEHYAALRSAEQALNASWPAACPRPQFWSGAFSFLAIDGAIKQACRYAASGGVERFASWVRGGDEVSLAERVARQLAASLAELRNVPLHLPAEDDAPDDTTTDMPAMPAPARGLAQLATN
jgi:hypothetical protein